MSDTETTYEHRGKAAIHVVMLAFAFAAVFSFFVWATGSGAELAEINYQANLIRLQAFMFGSKPRAVLVGSSISGRLLPSYFIGTDLSPVANLGLDGSGPPLGLNVVGLKPPPLVFVEANSLLKRWDKNDEALQEATKGPVFRLARYFPPLRASFRPSSVLYSWLKSHRNSTLQTGRGGNTRSQNIIAGPTNDLPSLDNIALEIKRLQTAGSKVVLVSIPSGNSLGESNSAAEELSQRLNIPFLDLQAECERRNLTLTYTDGLHLTSASARLVVGVLSSSVNERHSRLLP